MGLDHDLSYWQQGCEMAGSTKDLVIGLRCTCMVVRIGVQQKKTCLSVSVPTMCLGSLFCVTYWPAGCNSAARGYS
jgi:hypothetical protein